MDAQQRNFTEVFTEALTQLERDAKAAGSSLTAVCREAGISRTTPDRWKERPPATVATLARLQEVVADKAAKKAARASEEAANAAA